MISYWGVDHGGDEVSKGLGDYITARRTTHRNARARINAANPNGGWKAAADLDGLKKTFTSRKYRKQQTAELRGEYNKAKTNRTGS